MVRYLIYDILRHSKARALNLVNWVVFCGALPAGVFLAGAFSSPSWSVSWVVAVGWCQGWSQAGETCLVAALTVGVVGMAVESMSEGVGVGLLCGQALL